MKVYLPTVWDEERWQLSHTVPWVLGDCEVTTWDISEHGMTEGC